MEMKRDGKTVGKLLQNLFKQGFTAEDLCSSQLKELQFDLSYYLKAKGILDQRTCPKPPE